VGCLLRSAENDTHTDERLSVRYCISEKHDRKPTATSITLAAITVLTKLSISTVHYPESDIVHVDVGSARYWQLNRRLAALFPQPHGYSR
jgi:hypothetical protein